MERERTSSLKGAMKSPLLATLLPSTAIAVGMTTLMSQPGQASEYSYEVYENYGDWSYSTTRMDLPQLDRAYYQNAPSYHYAYYSIARPEYLL